MADKKRILVVDDCIPFIELAIEVFGADYSVDTAADGAAGLKKSFRDGSGPDITGCEYAGNDRG